VNVKVDCETYPVFVATVNNDEELRQKTLEEWRSFLGLYWKRCLTSKDITCKGYRSEDGVFVGGLNCPIRRCCSQNDFVTCANCAEYEMCDMLNGFYSIPLISLRRIILTDYECTDFVFFVERGV
jgi:hypothetical protein